MLFISDVFLQLPLEIIFFCKLQLLSPIRFSISLFIRRSINVFVRLLHTPYCVRMRDITTASKVALGSIESRGYYRNRTQYYYDDMFVVTMTRNARIERIY